MTSSSTDVSVKYEREFRKFLISRIQRLGGEILLQHITGHLSQVKPEIRSIIGTTKVDIINFLNKYCDTFMIHEQTVSLVSTNCYKAYDSDESTSDVEASLPSKISDGKGVIVKLTSAFGFIKSQRPIKTSVFFRASHFGYSRDTDLTDCGINIGTLVNFIAVKEKKPDVKSKYCALKVWKRNEDDTPIVSNLKKNRESGLYDPVTLDGEGVIQSVFPTHGFILVDGKRNNTVFFYKSRVLNYENITDLTKVFKTGDLVEFSSHRTTKSNSKARWEAIKVWKKSKDHNSKKSVRTFPKSTSSVVSSGTLNSSNFYKPAVLPGFYCQSSIENVDVSSKSTVQEIVCDQVGKICLRSSGVVIKFGKDFEQLADGDSSIYYIDNAKVEDVHWLFSEGDEVMFDAVKIKSTPGWKALLVWMGGTKPDVVVCSNLNDGALTDDEIEIDDAKSSTSGHDMSLSQHSSAKSESLLDIDNFKATKVFDEYYRCDTNLNNVEKIACNEEVKTCSLYDSSVSSRSQSSLSSKKESELSFHTFGSNTSEEHKKANRKSYETENYIKSSINTSTTASNVDLHSSTDIEECISIYESNKLDISSDSNSVSSKLSGCTEDSMFKDGLKCEDMSADNAINEVKKLSGVKRYENVMAKVTKVFSTFSEAKSPDSQIAAAFSWNIFYSNKNSMDDLGFSDLREVLKVGQPILFNKFEIIDDDGQSWQKITLAWTGCKPKKVPEMTPDEFIEQNNLSVSIRDICYVQPEKTMEKFLSGYDEVPCVVETLDKHQQVIKTPDTNFEEDSLTIPQKPVKFLSGYEEMTHNGLETEDQQTTEAPLTYSDDESAVSFIESDSTKKSPLEFRSLPVMLNKKLKQIDICLNSDVDLEVLSSAVVNLIFKRYKLSSPSSENLETLTSSCSCRKRKTLDVKQDIKNHVEVQTVTTGQILSQNIYVDG